MTKEQAEKVFEVLSAHAGAFGDLYNNFVQVMTSDEPPREYRFQGRLGFGGKYWLERNQITCYPEDEDAIRAKIIERTNKRLEEVLKVKP